MIQPTISVWVFLVNSDWSSPCCQAVCSIINCRKNPRHRCCASSEEEDNETTTTVCGVLICAIKPQNQTKYKIRQVAVHQSLFMRASRQLLCFIFSSRQKQWLLCPNLLNMMGKALVHIAGEDEKSIGSSPALHAQQSGIYHNDKYL